VEERWGEEWKPGMRVRVFHARGTPPDWHVGTIVDRSWGRERGKPIYRFTVQLDGIDGTWIFNPGQLHDEPTS
jgi:hypothetical protein